MSFECPRKVLECKGDASCDFYDGDSWACYYPVEAKIAIAAIAAAQIEAARVEQTEN